MKATFPHVVTMCCAAGLLFTLGSPSPANAAADSENLTLDQMPPKVRATLIRESTGGKLLEMEKDEEDGAVVYEATVLLDGHEYEVQVASDGKLLVKELDTDDDDDDDDDAGESPPSMSRQVFLFSEDAVGAVPAGWKVAETAGGGSPATWEVIRDAAAPSAPNVVAITKNSNFGHTFNLLMAPRTHYRDLHLTVRVKAMEGQEDQGGGPFWRARDGNNYYTCRWNPLEQNFRLYFVKHGRRRQLATASVVADPSKWHTIEIRHQGTKIQASFDSQKLLEAQDDTFTTGGAIGLWVKADGATAFDDLMVEPMDAARSRAGDDDGNNNDS